MFQIKSRLFNGIKVKNSYILTFQYSRSYEIDAGYKPKSIEQKLPPVRSNNNNFKNNNKFSMILPPPNITGHLHLGHALMCTIQDVIARWKRAKGYDVIWIPGSDHAGIATQLVVEKTIFKEARKTRHDLGREQFLDEIWKWKNEKGNRIKEDLKRLGTTMNWDREYFTMDENQSKAVDEAFIRLFENNLIYRSDSLVNWSCSLESTISDIEVDILEINVPTPISVPGYSKPIVFGELTDIAYKVNNDNEAEIIVSTTRPETLLGDVAVAVHPTDTRYTKLLNDKVMLQHPFRSDLIPLIADEGVDSLFGSGAVKITPAHDKFDYEVAKKNRLPSLSVINEKGLITDQYTHFAGMPRFLARQKIKDKLTTLGLLRQIRPHKIQLPMCSRSKDIVEYLPKPQWFLKCDEIAQTALNAVQSNQIKINPKNFEQEWYRWLENSKDWCISRQVWWGHQIPVYECSIDERKIWIAATTKDEATAKAKTIFCLNHIESMEIKRDTDVLDTWFSSALLPFSQLGWPSTHEKYYPLDLMETGHDILFFWVARMAMLGLYFTGTVPFKEILLHGIICDAQGRKMSKSLGNVIYPEQVISGATVEELKHETTKLYESGILSKDELRTSLKGQQKLFPNGIPECGVDALRFTLCSHNIKSHFINFDVIECNANKLFFNKIWQAMRYTILFHQKTDIDLMALSPLNDQKLTEMDRWILSRLGHTVLAVNEAMAEYNFHLATSSLKRFFYANFCDVYVETTKTRTHQNADQKSCCFVLKTCLAIGLELMEHFTPFLTAELSRYLPNNCSFEAFDWINKELEHKVEDILNVCAEIRKVKNEENIGKKHEPKVHLFSLDAIIYDHLLKHKTNIQLLSQCNEIYVHNKLISDSPMNLTIKATAGHLCSFGIEAKSCSAQDTSKRKKLEKLKQDLGKLQQTVASDGYKKAANEKIQQKHLEKIHQLRAEIANLQMINNKI